MDSFPATSGQASVWFADQYIAGSSAYNVTLIFEILGDLTRREFEAACTSLTAGTPTLNMRMGIDDRGDVAQWYCPGPPWIDWVDSDAEIPDERVGEFMQAHIVSPLPSDGGRLVRFVAARTRPQKLVVAVLVHHTLMDGLSKSLLAERLLAALGGRLRAQPLVRYRELVDWVIAEEEKAFRSDAEYWAARLTDGLTADPASIPAVGGVSARSRRVRGLVPPKSLLRFQEMARSRKISDFLVVFATLHHTLARWGARSTTVCTAASVRPPDGSYDDTLGCFINQLPLIAGHQPDDSLVDLLDRESTRWREDLRRRNLSLMTIMNVTHEFLAHNSIRLDRVFTSYLRLPGTIRRYVGNLSVEVDLFNTYHEAKTDLCVRFVPTRDNELWYDVEWSADAPPTLGPKFESALQALFRCEQT